MTTSTTVASFCGSATRVHAGEYPSPSPTCSIGTRDCNKLYQDHLLAPVYSIYTPLCSTAASYKPSCGECTVFANGMQLFYWPVTTVHGNVCAGNGSTITASPTGKGPNTTIKGNRTYTSGTAYYSFSDLFATVSNGAMCGTPEANVELPIFTFDLSTISYSPTQPSPGITLLQSYSQSMNLADLNYPVPWSAWRGQEACASNVSICETISTSYRPDLVIATWLTELQDQWTTCVVSAIVFDPPVALGQQAVLQLPTAAVLSTTASEAGVQATPGSGLTSVQPVMTGAATMLSSSTTSTAIAEVPLSTMSDPGMSTEDVNQHSSYNTPTIERPATTPRVDESHSHESAGTSTTAGGQDPTLSTVEPTYQTTAPDISGTIASFPISDIATSTLGQTSISADPALHDPAGVASAILQLFSVSSTVTAITKSTLPAAEVVLLSALIEQSTTSASTWFASSADPAALLSALLTSSTSSVTPGISTSAAPPDSSTINGISSGQAATAGVPAAPFPSQVRSGTFGTFSSTASHAFGTNLGASQPKVTSISTSLPLIATSSLIEGEGSDTSTLLPSASSSTERSSAGKTGSSPLALMSGLYVVVITGIILLHT
ncbi:hypothetical protein LTR62_003699 [Meristemomyces frigidus]|uniref:Uncharacterized protein n=1 Tax=Meristemomyces frigidus TaxID=1508187 RepID=A0AAN7TKQ1_9PEZI|nr:hypothetical protein LTR62_003699 [Meristemomyces frigidus]